jgi:hypothetical protein
VDDRVLEEHDVHLGHLGHLVVVFKSNVQLVAEGLEVEDFLVDFALALGVEHEVSEDSVLLVGCAVGLVRHLEVEAELLFEEGLEEFLIVVADQTIVEHTQGLVAPETDDLFFGLI